jgi:diguanylate cyclase (GGDEF)-like protein
MDETLAPEGQAPALPSVEWDPEFVDQLYEFLAGLETRSDSMAEDVAALVEEHGEVVYSELIYVLSNLRFDEAEARPHWEQILEHRQSMLDRLGVPVDLRVALTSYFLEVNRKLRNPKIIEIQLFAQAQASACRDELTGLYNYRLFREHLSRELFRSARNSTPLSLIMIDVDNFKSYNDRNGHEAGNQALVAVAKLLTALLRKTDIAARYGGEEFTLILPATPKTSAQMVAERTRELVERHVFADGEVEAGSDVTVSMGLATFPADAADTAELVRHADRALYVAKNKGKNQVVLYGESRRSFGRVNVAIPGTFRVLTPDSHSMTTVNLSESGVMFRTEHELAVGTVIEFKIQSPGSSQPITASGRVVHIDAQEEHFLTAVHITDTRNEERAALRRILLKSSRSFDLP